MGPKTLTYKVESYTAVQQYKWPKCFSEVISKDKAHTPNTDRSSSQ